MPATGNKDNIVCEDRKLTLLKMFGLTNHLYTEYTQPEQVIVLENIGNDIFKKIAELRVQSINYILESIGFND